LDEVGLSSALRLYLEGFAARSKIKEPEKLRERMEAAEVAMLLRSRALVHSSDGHAEKQAIRDAITKLRLIQTELGYPDWNP